MSRPKGFKHSETTRNKIKQSNLGKKKPNDGRTKKIYYCIELNCNNKISYTNWLYGTKRCISCGCKLTRDFKGKKNPLYKGKTKHEGYIYILISEHTHTRATWQKRYVKRADLVMEKMIGRPLKSKEIVHHKNSIRDDDKPKNLKLFKNQAEHKRFEKRKGE